MQRFEGAIREGKCEERDWWIRVGAEWVVMELHGEKAGFGLLCDCAENEVLVAKFPFSWVEKMMVLVLFF